MRKGTFIERPLGASSAASPAPALTLPLRTVSVIVPVFNGAGVIESCLRSLDRQTFSRDEYEVIVIDDGSTDATREIVKRVSASARASIVLIEQTRNAGPAAARNAGLAAARSTFIAFTDADCEADPRWLERGMSRLQSDQTLAGIEGATIPKGETGTYTHQMENTQGGLYMTCNMIYRKDALGSGFDHRFRMAFLEDSDLAFSILDRNERIEFCSDVIVHHLVLHEGPRKFFRDARKRYYNPLLRKKHPLAYQRLLKPVVPALPAHYLTYMFSVALTALSFATHARLVGTLMTLFALWTLKPVAFSLKARGWSSLLQAATVPFVQTLWTVAGMIRFRSFSLRV